MLQGVDVDPVLQVGDLGRHIASADFHQIGAAGQQGLVAHPQEVRGELVGDFGPHGAQGEQVAPGDVDLVGQGQGHRLAGPGLGQVAVIGDDAGDLGFPARCRHGDRIARPDDAGSNGAGKAAEIQVGTVHPLHREAEGLFGRIAFDVDGLQVLDQSWALVPGRVGRSNGDIVPMPRRQGNRGDGGEAQGFGERPVLGDDAVEHRLIVGR